MKTKNVYNYGFSRHKKLLFLRYYKKVHAVNNCIVQTLLKILSFLISFSLSFFLSFFLILTSFYLLILSTDGYCCTDHTYRHKTLVRIPTDEASARRRDLYLTTQYTQKTYFHVPRGIRTGNPSKRAAADPSFRQRGHQLKLINHKRWYNKPATGKLYVLTKGTTLIVPFSSWHSHVATYLHNELN
jgi:hypothetical protein